MNQAQKATFLTAVDSVLLPLGFKRRKSDQKWRRQVDVANEAWIHLNFGLTVVNPSFGVNFIDLDDFLPSDAGPTPGVFNMLPRTAATQYTEDSNPNDLAEDIHRQALPAIRSLLNRTSVTLALKEEDPKQWPVLGATSRMRLLPIKLASQGELDEALRWVTHFEKNDLHRDQQMPRYPQFAAIFRATVNSFGHVLPSTSPASSEAMDKS